MINLFLAIVAVICWLRTIFVVLKLPLVHKFLHTEINEIRLTYRVQQGELFVHNLQWRCHLFVVTIELLKDLLSFSLWQFNQQALRRFNIECCDEQMGAIWRYLHNVVSLTKIFAALIKNKPVFVEILSLTDHRKQVISTVNASWGSSHVRTASMRWSQATAWPWTLSCTSDTRQRSITLISLNVGSGEHVPLSAIDLIEFVRILANVIASFSDLLELLFPVSHTVSGLLFLQSF